MARSFDGAKSQYLYYAGTVVSATPFTVACWAYPTSLSGSNTCFCVSNDYASSASRTLRLTILATTGVVRVVAHNSAVQGAADSTAAVNLNAWNHVAGVWASTSSRTAYLNGGNSGTNTTDVTPTGLVSSYAGRTGLTPLQSYMYGSIAELAVWSAALTAAEIAALASRYSPLLIRPSSLVAYWPLGGMWGQYDYDRWKRAYDLTPYPAAPNAPTWADHPPGLIYPPGLSL